VITDETDITDDGLIHLFIRFIRFRGCFKGSLHSPAPRLEVGANRTKSTEGTESQISSMLQSVSTDFALLAPTSSRGAGWQRSEALFNTFKAYSNLDFTHLLEPLHSIDSGLPDFL
jgi:hypothetical protein